MTLLQFSNTLGQLPFVDRDDLRHIHNGIAIKPALLGTDEHIAGGGGPMEVACQHCTDHCANLTSIECIAL